MKLFEITYTKKGSKMHYTEYVRALNKTFAKNIITQSMGAVKFVEIVEMEADV